MRLGKYTGKIYEEYEVSEMEECGICITDEQSKDKDWIKKHHAKDLVECLFCCGCPQAQKGCN